MKSMKSDCKSSVELIGNKLIIKDICKIPLTQLLNRVPNKYIPESKTSKHYTGKQKLNPVIQEECKGTHGKERRSCIKNAKQSLKESRHEEQISQYEDLDDSSPILPRQISPYIKPYDKEWALRA